MMNQNSFIHGSTMSGMSNMKLKYEVTVLKDGEKIHSDVIDNTGGFTLHDIDELVLVHGVTEIKIDVVKVYIDDETVFEVNDE